MKILIINWRDPTHPWAGGAEVFLNEVACRWVKAGHSVTWFCGKHESQNQQDCIEGIDFYRRGSIYSVYPAAAVTYLSRFQRRFDVLLESTNGIPFFTTFYSNIPKVTLVHHVHGEVFMDELPWYLAYPGRALEYFGFQFAYKNTPFIAVSDSTKQALIEIGIPEKQITIIHNAVDGAVYKPGIKSQTPLIVFVGRLRHYKRVDVAIRAMPHLLSKIPELQLIIIGSGPMESSLLELTKKLGLTNNIQFTGYVDQATKIKYMQRAHIAVHPSMKEGWGLTVLEFNACVTPVVASNVLGLRDSVIDGETGVLVPFANPKALADELLRLLQDHDRRSQMADKAMAWAAQFNWDRTAQQCLTMLRDQIEKPGPKKRKSRRDHEK